jgi:hypothetical protein
MAPPQRPAPRHPVLSIEVAPGTGSLDDRGRCRDQRCRWPELVHGSERASRSNANRSWFVSRSEFCSVAARTVLAAADECSPVDRFASGAAGGPELPCLPTVVAVTVTPSRWCARHGPLSEAGSCRPSRERQSETTSADYGRRDRVTVAGSEVCYQHPDSHHRQIMHPGTTHFHAVSLTSARKDTSSCQPLIIRTLRATCLGRSVFRPPNRPPARRRAPPGPGSPPQPPRPR